MTPVEYLDADQIVQRLDARRNGRKIAVFHREIERLTGMTISYSHLFNILTRRREPNDCVLKYLGGSTANVYRVERPMGRPTVKGKAKR